jgi:hypothetical protein
VSHEAVRITYVDGLRDLLQPRREQLLSPRLWLAGAGYTCQLFGLGQGVPIELAARNSFDQRHLTRDVVIIVAFGLVGTLVSGTIGKSTWVFAAIFFCKTTSLSALFENNVFMSEAMAGGGLVAASKGLAVDKINYGVEAAFILYTYILR